MILFTGGVFTSLHVGIPHPPGSRHTDISLEADTPQEQTPLGANTPLEQTPPRSKHPPGANTPHGKQTLMELSPPGADIHLRRRACWEVRSTRGTGMLFLSKFILRVQKSILTYYLFVINSSDIIFLTTNDAAENFRHCTLE